MLHYMWSNGNIFCVTDHLCGDHLYIHRSPVTSPHKGKWRGALMFSLIWVWINGWVNNGEAGNLRRKRAHYDVIVMRCLPLFMIRFRVIIPIPFHVASNGHTARVYWFTITVHWNGQITSSYRSYRTTVNMLDIKLLIGSNCQFSLDWWQYFFDWHFRVRSLIHIYYMDMRKYCQLQHMENRASIYQARRHLTDKSRSIEAVRLDVISWQASLQHRCEVPVKYKSVWKRVKPNLAASKLHKTLP